MNLQLQRFREDLWGRGCVDYLEEGRKPRYDFCLPSDVELIPCEENEHGELVPKKDLGDKMIEQTRVEV